MHGTGETHQKAFDDVKKELGSGPVLAMYHVDCKTIDATDASNHGIGAILSQVQNDGTTRLVAAASRALIECEKR